jgi:tRNA (guanine-N7-)-methyltransferase
VESESRAGGQARPRRRRIEREFGVPFAGEILEPAQWTRTALKRLPDAGPLDWNALFGRHAPVVLDVGCGNGRFLIHSAVWRPDHDHLGIDILPVVLRYATRRGNQRGLGNLRFALVGGREFLQRYVAPHTLAEIHCYHPQPFDAPPQPERRLLTPTFLALVHQALVPGGKFFVQTDHAGYWRYLLSIVTPFFEFEEQTRPWPDGPKGRTRREIIALRRGLPVYRGLGTARTGLSSDELTALAKSLPQPDFAPEWRLRELDELESEEL